MGTCLKKYDFVVKVFKPHEDVHEQDLVRIAFCDIFVKDFEENIVVT